MRDFKALTTLPKVHRRGLAGAILGLFAIAFLGSQQAEGNDQAGATAPPKARVMLGKDTTYAPKLDLGLEKISIIAPIRYDLRLESVSDFTLDRYGTQKQGATAIDTQARVGLQLNTKMALAPFNIGITYEHDLITGTLSGKPELGGEGYPDSRPVEHQLRKANARLSLGYFLHLFGGYTISDWGLGLLANGGNHTWRPGQASFTDPRGGDRVLRLLMATGPVGSAGLLFAVSHDWVQQDDRMLEEDEARQVAGTFIIGAGQPTMLGFYSVYRTQEGPGGEMRVTAVDLYGKTSQRIWGQLFFDLELEGAIIVGETTFGALAEFPRKDVNQGALALHSVLRRDRLGAILDFLFASGDSNLDDGQQTSFLSDPNYQLGLLLYRYLLAYQTARAVATAGDPLIMGYPPEGLSRFPTRGGITNTIAFFPKGYWRPLDGLEVYGGFLFALCATPNVDPLNTKEQGGVPHNALLGKPGRYLGTEIDLGLRYRMLLYGTALTLGAETGFLFPGAAFTGTEASSISFVFGGRSVVNYKF